MASLEATTSGSGPTSGASRSDGQRGRGRGRGRGSRGRGRGNRRPAEPQNPAAQDVAATVRARNAAIGLTSRGTENGGEANSDSEADVCFICANPVAHHSIAPCNHTTCHICGLRMRALYKTKDCAHCRTPAPFVIFTDDADKRFEEYTDADITTADSNIGIKYTNEDIVGDTVLLLRYNCPDPSCDFAGLGWPDLHRHVKSAHHKRMCDLCTRNKKVFTHEHELFADRELERHMKHGDDQPGAADQTGFKGHPLCGFCGERFYDDDRLYEHCRLKHERCFICDRRDSRKPHYYQDYDRLEKHFKKDHYLCNDRECLEKKFVVFESEMDLQAHRLNEHPSGKHAGRDARLVDISGFDIRQSYQQEGRGGRQRGGGRGRDQNADVTPANLAQQPLRRDEVAFQRQMAIHSAQSVSNRTFGGQLTTPSASSGPAITPPTGPRNNSSPSTPRLNQQSQPHPPTDPMDSLSLTDTSQLSTEERARLVRHSAVVERAANLLGNDRNKVASFRKHISSYRQGELSAPQLIDAFFTLFSDASSNALGTLVREVAELFEDKSRADALRKAWSDWRAINEDYPSLPGLSGMYGATTGSSGWASAAAANPAIPHAAPSQKHSNRVLRLKNSTRLGGPAPTTPRSVGWTASSVQTPSSSSSAAFPSLSASNAGSSRPTPLAYAGASTRPSWGGASVSTATTTRTSADAFPALPSAPKPTTTIFGYGGGRGVIRDHGSRDTGFQWGSPAESPSTEDPPALGDEQGKGKKGGKKGKKVLVQWG